MVLLGLILAAMTALVLALLLWPLLRPAAPAASRRQHDLAVYRQQLSELEAERARDLIPAEAAEEARREVERRLLTAGAQDEPEPAASPAWRRAAVWGLALLLPAAAAALYLTLGTPGAPDVPWRARQAAANMAAGHDAETEKLVAKLAARMAEHPNDPQGWRLLGRSYLTMGRFMAAADAFSRVLALDPSDMGSRLDMAEAMTLAADGQITPAARVGFEAAHAAEPKNPRPRYYLALAALQDGRPQEAYDEWLALARDAPAGATWLPLVRERLADVAGQLGIDLAADLPAAPAPTVPAPASGPSAGAASPGATAAAPKAAAPGPSAADVAAASQMSAGDRQAFIRSMVARLAERLQQTPDDFDGWMRLGRARRVLGEPAVAAEAYAKAAALRPKDATPLAARAAALIAAAPEGAPPPPAAVQAYRRVLELEPSHADALWYTGLAALAAGQTDAAIDAWQRLLAQLDPASPDYARVRQGLDRARAKRR